MSLVAWYPLIDGSLENKGLDTTPLTLHGTVPFTNGRVRTAPTFSANGSNWLGHSIFEAKANFSAFCWVKFNDHATFQYVFSQCRPDANADGWGIVRNKNGEIAFCFGNLANKLGTVVEDSTWAHVGLTVTENGTITGYVDGEQVYQETATDLPSYLVWQGFNLGVVGGNSLAQYSPLNGQLQDFRYYDHCLSPKEVKEIAKGLCLHLPLKGTNARPNLFKNSATMFNGIGGAPVSTPCTSSPTLVFDENAPCGVNGKILRATVNRPDDTVSIGGGYFFNTAMTGIPTLTIGQKYCVSVWARSTVNNVNFLLEPFMEGHTFVKGSVNRTLTSEWKRYYAIFTATKTGSTTCFFIYAPIGASGTLEYCCPKLELLSPTPYIPNVNDTQYSDYVLDYEPDCSGNEFDATKYGDLTTSDSNGRYNTAVAFNGTNTYLQGLAPTNSECKEFTIATWVKLNNVSVNQAIYACRTERGGLALFCFANGNIRLDDGAVNAVFANAALETNKWYHIAVTRDTAERKLYINGSFVSSGATTGALTNMGTMYQVGESNAQTTNPIGNVLNGSLSDFRLYTSVLSADDVKELYETSVSIAHNPPSLTESAYYNYVEGQKHSTFDKSKFTVVGSPTITDDGVYTCGYSKANYVKVPFDNTLDNFSIDIEINILDRSQSGYYLGHSNNISYGFMDAFFNGVGATDFRIRVLDETGTAQNLYMGNSFYSIGIEKINVTFTGTQYILTRTRADGVVYTKTVNSTFKPATNFFSLGCSDKANVPSPTINLTKITVTTDGKEVFSGNKTGLNVIKPDNYTVVGSPVISEDGVASGFSGSNYLTETTTLNLTKPFEIKFKVNHKSASSSQQAFISFNGTGWYNYILDDKTRLVLYGKFADDTLYDFVCTGLTTNEQTYYICFSWDGNTYILKYSTDNLNWVESKYNSSVPLMGFDNINTICIGRLLSYNYYPLTTGSIDLNAFKIYVDGNLVYQPCLKIPYTESKTGIKVVDSTYLDRVKDVYDQHYLERYYTVDETTQTVYEYPLFRDSMHSYEFDEGIQASITKNGIHNATTLTEATKTSMYQNNTDTVALIEN